ncbi:MAG: phosphate acyltransferase PlsX [Acidobacteriota bacterium]|nr:phosphate acyltransferase PlsX [Acidobacteriota bacterium]
MSSRHVEAHTGPLRIAVDATGGDYAPRNIIDGALVAARHLGVGIIFVGVRESIHEELRRHGDAGTLDVSVVDAPDAIDMRESPASALRRKPRAAVRLAADLVAKGEAVALFSAGNTGATMLSAHRAFGRLPGVDRPALATTIPTVGRGAVLLDSGANVECRAQHLLQFAAMGTAYARVVLGVPRPRVGLLSIGEEETKGNELTRETHSLLRDGTLAFVGNIEARDLYRGQAEVIVCDGFTGNIALKVSEGLVEVVEEFLRDELNRTFGTRVGYLLSRRAFRRFRKRFDYSEVGGAPLLGVSGLCIVGHGRSSIKAVRNALAMAYRFATRNMLSSIERELRLTTGAIIGSASVPARVSVQWTKG